MAAHSTLTGADLHEPKGAAAASANQVYAADGAGSGAWAKIDADNIDTSSIKNTNKYKVSAVIDDVSTAATILVPVPEACTFNSARMSLGTGITVADATLEFLNSTGPTSIGTQVITQAASAEGTSFTFTASSNNTFSANTYLKITTDGASTTTAPLYITLSFTLT